MCISPLCCYSFSSGLFIGRARIKSGRRWLAWLLYLGCSVRAAARIRTRVDGPPIRDQNAGHYPAPHRRDRPSGAMPENPIQELWVALAGPAVNVAIAAVLFILLAATLGFSAAANLSTVTGSLLQRLLAVNLSPRSIQHAPRVSHGWRPGLAHAVPRGWAVGAPQPSQPMSVSSWRSVSALRNFRQTTFVFVAMLLVPLRRAGGSRRGGDAIGAGKIPPCATP